MMESTVTSNQPDFIFFQVKIKIQRMQVTHQMTKFISSQLTIHFQPSTLAGCTAMVMEFELQKGMGIRTALPYSTD